MLRTRNITSLRSRRITLSSGELLVEHLLGACHYGGLRLHGGRGSLHRSSLGLDKEQLYTGILYPPGRTG